MKRLPQGHYSKEFREEAVKLVKEGEFSLGDVCSQLSVPKSTLEAWIRAAVKGTLGEIGKGQRPLTELELELAKMKKELAQVRMERDILKKAAAYFAKESLQGMR